MKNLKFVVLSLAGIFFLSVGFAQSPVSKKKTNNPSAKSIEAATKATDALNAKLIKSDLALQLSAEKKEAIKNLYIERNSERSSAIKKASSEEEKKQIIKDFSRKYNKLIQANHLTSAQKTVLSVKKKTGNKKMPKATTAGAKKGKKTNQNLINRAKKQVDVMQQKMLLGDPEAKLSEEQKTILQEQYVDRFRNMNRINRDASLSPAEKKKQLNILFKAGRTVRNQALTPKQAEALSKGHRMEKAKK